MNTSINEKIFDFLYSDHTRVASILSQLDGAGDLKSTQRVSGKTKGDERKISAKVPILSGQKTIDTEYNRELRQEYDPLWINSKTLISNIMAKNQGKEFVDYNYGDLKIISGKLICMDQSIFNALLKSPSIINQLSQGMGTENDENRSSKAKKQNKQDLANIVRDFIQTLPLGVVFTLITETDVFWFNIKREYLQLQDLDIPLKFPFEIGGTWHVAGIIDALPSDYYTLEKEVESLGQKRVFSQGIELITGMITPMVGLFGRPADAYGLNPVTIFRELSIQ